MSDTTARGRGRPYIGDIVEVRLPPDVIALFEAEAGRREVKRAELMRAVLLEHAATLPPPPPKPKRRARAKAS